MRPRRESRPYLFAEGRKVGWSWQRRGPDGIVVGDGHEAAEWHRNHFLLIVRKHGSKMLA